MRRLLFATLTLLLLTACSQQPIAPNTVDASLAEQTLPAEENVTVDSYAYRDTEIVETDVYSPSSDSDVDLYLNASDTETRDYEVEARQVPANEGDLAQISTFLTDDEIREKYQRAVTVSEWFFMGTIPYDEDDYIDIGYDTIDMETGSAYRLYWRYFRVAYGDLTTLLALENYLHTIFGIEYTQLLLASSSFIPTPGYRFIEVDGFLYTVGTDHLVRDSSNATVVEEAHEIIRVNNRRITYRVTTEIFYYPFRWFEDEWVMDFEDLIEEVIEHDFHLSFINGRWVFENFHLVR